MDDRVTFPLDCRYQNTTDKFQIIIVNTLERFLMPGMSIEFSAQLEDYITVKDGLVTSIWLSSSKSDKICLFE